MKVRDFYIGWLHTTDMLPKSQKEVPATVCTIFTFEGEGENKTKNTHGTGLAICSPHDIYDKETGRKKSLEKALINAGLGKSIRGEVWEKYRTLSTNKPRWSVTKKERVK